MSIVSHNQKTDHSDELIQNNDLNRSVDSFISQFEVVKHLYRCGAGKARGVAISVIFAYLLKLVFMNKSMYMQMHQGKFNEDFSKNAVYRFLDNPKANWQKYTVELSADIINNMLRDLTSNERRDAFVIDDSLFDRSRSKNVELLSRVFDHCGKGYKKGFRLLTLGWSDGATFLPIDFCLLSSTNEKNRFNSAKSFDRRTLAYRRREQSQTKSTDVVMQLLESATKAGHSAKCVLFDSWFSEPVNIQRIKKMGLDTVAMVKKSSKINYLVGDEKLNVKQIYSRNNKRRGRSKYLLSVDVMLGKEDKELGLEPINARIVYVRNRANKKDWLAIVCTDMNLSEEEIIAQYGKRWAIEVFFKTCKSYLHLVKEYRGLSFDAMCGHVAVVFTRYMILAVNRRYSNDHRSLGEIFFFMVDEIADITFDDSMQIIFTALFEAISVVFQPTEAKMTEFISTFLGGLPDYMQKALSPMRESLAA